MGNATSAKASTSRSIAGGFIRIDVAKLAHAWEACRSRPLGIGDFRTWLAAHELVTRRQAGADRRASIYRTAELANLLGVKIRTAAAAVRRLVDAGLITWAEAAIDFPTPAMPHRPPAELSDTIGRGRGAVSIPRRVLRFLARGGTTALIATALGALLRCLSRRRDGFRSRGRFKASWVARTFGVAGRHAKAARARLVALGWLEPEEGDQWAMNRWGRTYRIRLDWADPDAVGHPSPASIGRQSSPPNFHPDPLREEEHPEPAPGGPAGALTPRFGEADLASKKQPAANNRAGSPLPPPNLRDMRLEDLEDTGRTLELHRQAIRQKLITSSEADRVRFVAAAEHARAVGRRNPCGLLARILRLGWWHLVTQRDEDRAALRLREHEQISARSWQPAMASATPAPAPGRRPLSNPEASARSPSVLSDLLDRFPRRSGC